ncbi:cupin domain-containing protein [Salinadaptatus halalkaliphilus]|uniref:Cupin domain-containing protein n=1 Tax=Salinadaptatus halalkaliphilus TaxID=2419781 RepID=A0A4S3TQR9_9EURY|nr:cupin domain-containing protein [Salinadaptatus halalkaliphilus]THE65980.1 cupin domain-containing protein [Salinadaptatus halalkaliphilus]
MVRSYDESAVPAVYNFRDAPTYRDEPGITQTIFRGLDQMVGFTVIEPDKPDATPHTHPYEQVNMLIDGELDFLVGDERLSLEPDDVLAIPPEVEHTSRAVADDPATLLAFWPLREDRLDGTQYQSEFDT